ncbi:hypothetical protein BHE74_00025913 [Ensete ventricosum]|nr:hypothetical protein BHE74_00025913 [Ensete ventricosum]
MNKESAPVVVLEGYWTYNVKASNKELLVGRTINAWFGGENGGKIRTAKMASDDDAPPMLGSYLIPGIKCCAIDRSRRARSKEKTSKEKRNDSISFGAARSHARGILELRSFF